MATREKFEALNKESRQAEVTLSANSLTDVHQIIHSAIAKKIGELTAGTNSSIEFEWNNQFETDIEQLGSIQLNSQTNISPSSIFPPQMKPVMPDYKAKQLPTAYCCKQSSDNNAPGELNYSRDYLFMFSEKMSQPVGISISQDKVFVTQWSGHCINKYELEGKPIMSVGSKGNEGGQFSSPRGIDVSDRNSNVYVCDWYNDRVQILTEELKFHSMLGRGLFNYPRDVKVTRDRVLVLNYSDPCMFVSNSDHVLTNRLITRGDGKQINNPWCFDIDRDYSIIMSDYNNHCVYVFNQEGEQIHKFGKQGQGIGEFYCPYGIVLDNTGHIVVVCQKKKHYLQFF
ncbi:Tripartite motif-containing protein 3-like [Oopsacas minuta]|uniref:Tripartite motif-containing protein 3-like n=1 Tax=Oopsacas minuta TaxID=111878 RepID=A0AAV7K1J1_9METZ|nr:Tripartite motif-containing protein 3-like [Oopsacas minuta]